MTRGAAHNVGKDRNDECGRVSEDDVVVHVMMRDTVRSKGGAMESQRVGFRSREETSKAASWQWKSGQGGAVCVKEGEGEVTALWQKEAAIHRRQQH